MAVEEPSRSLIHVERGIEEALRDFAGGVNGSELPDITAAERIDKIGNMSALAIVEASELTAKDIEEAGQLTGSDDSTTRVFRTKENSATYASAFSFVANRRPLPTHCPESVTA